VKTTIELPDELLQRAKAAAALKGESLRDLFTAALSDHLARIGGAVPAEEGWRKVFGTVERAEVEAVDLAVGEDLERVDLDSWR
jgi:hypothetical protein